MPNTMPHDNHGAAMLKRYRIMLILLSVVALSASAFLAWSTIRHGTVAGCDHQGIFDCSHVLNSRWAKVFYIPVSLPAAALHSCLITLLLCSFFVRDGSWQNRLQFGILCFVAAAGCAALWFVGLQVFVEGKLCQYCMTAHLAGLTAVAVAAWASGFRVARLAKPFALSASLVGVLIAAQIYGPVADKAKVVRLDEFADEESSVELLEIDFDALELPDESELDADASLDAQLAALDGQPLDDSSALQATAIESDNTKTATSLTPIQSDTNGDLVAEATPQTLASELVNENAELKPVSAAEEPTSTEPAVMSDATELTPTLETGMLHGYDESRGIVSTDLLEPSDGGDALLHPSEAEAHMMLDLAATTNPAPSPSPVPQEDKVATRVAASAPRQVEFRHVKTILKVKNWPMLGDPNAEVVAVNLFDYTCGHCRKVSRELRLAREKFGTQLAIVTLPVPLHPDCNQTVTQSNPTQTNACELANLAISVWRIAPNKFESFHDWLCEPDQQARTLTEAHAKARSLVGQERLTIVQSSSIPGKYIHNHVELYKRAPETILPQLYTQRLAITGETNVNQLSKLLVQEHGLKPQPVLR